jgi:prostatic aicd phosphatase
LEKIGKICGVDMASIPTLPGGEDHVLAIKDIADMFIFDRDDRDPAQDIPLTRECYKSYAPIL